MIATPYWLISPPCVSPVSPRVPLLWLRIITNSPRAILKVGDSHDLCSGVTNQKDTNRPLLWEDEAPAVARVRRMQEGVPVAGRIRRGSPGMPLEMEDAEGDDEVRPGTRTTPRGKWWRPSSKAGRIFLAFGTLTVLAGVIFLGITVRTYIERDGRFRIAGAANIQATGLNQVSRTDMLPI